MRSLLKIAMTVAALAASVTSAAAQAAAPQADPLKFTSSTAIIYNQVKTEKAADFEAVWGEIKKGLAASSKPELQQQATAFKIFKLAVEPPAGQPTTYVFYIDPVPAGVTFDPVKILYESGAFERAKADELYAKVKDAYAGIFPWPLVAIGG